MVSRRDFIKTSVGVVGDLAVGLVLGWALKPNEIREADKLSGGEGKIVAVLRALLANPQLLLVDEPTEGMAPIMVDRTVRLLKDINEARGLTIIWVEPGAKLKKVLEIASKLVVISAGRIAYIGAATRAKEDIDKIKRALFI